MSIKSSGGRHLPRSLMAEDSYNKSFYNNYNEKPKI
jgi:hypothetical protein